MNAVELSIELMEFNDGADFNLISNNNILYKVDKELSGEELKDVKISENEKMNSVFYRIVKIN